MKNKFLIGALSLAVTAAVFFVVLGITGTLARNSSVQTLEVDEADEEIITVDQIAPVDKASGKINILILGVDVDGLRTDTIIIASYDLDENKINMLSIPRDTRMYVGSRYQKINAAHAITQKGGIKGPQGSIEAVTRLTGIPINYYVELSFSSFRDAIDALGGVDFDVPRNMDYEDPYQDLYIHLKKGQQHLDGDKAEQLVRFRRYPEGDIARVKMQQEFIRAVAEQKLNLSIIDKIPDLFKTFQDDIDTNFTLIDVMKYLPNVKELSSDDITMYQVPGSYNDEDYGASYWIADMTALKKLVSETFKYSAAKATIHSADGTSVSKDTKTAKSTAKPDGEVIYITPKPSSKASPSPESSARSGKTPGAYSSPKPSGSPRRDDDDDDDDDDTPSSTKRPSASPSQSARPSTQKETPPPEVTKAPEATKEPAPAKTSEPTKAPEPAKEPTPVEKPAVARPTANPTSEENNED